MCVCALEVVVNKLFRATSGSRWCLDMYVGELLVATISRKFNNTGIVHIAVCLALDLLVQKVCIDRWNYVAVTDSGVQISCELFNNRACGRLVQI